MADDTKKPIEDITDKDWVISVDKDYSKAAGEVRRTFVNKAKIILDFHGTFIMLGHAYSCA